MFFKTNKLNCPICFEDSRKNVTLACGHSSCKKCHKKHMKASIDRKCHMCRAPVVNKLFKFKMRMNENLYTWYSSYSQYTCIYGIYEFPM